MKTQDDLGKYMKELPMEAPSFEFTSNVMGRVLAETKISPAEYNPLISNKMWIRIVAGLFVFLVGLTIIRTYFPGNENPAGWQSIYNFDLSAVFGPFLKMARIARSLPISFAGGLMAFSFLLLADRFYSRNTQS